jgi:hypothetical protein
MSYRNYHKTDRSMFNTLSYLADCSDVNFCKELIKQITDVELYLPVIVFMSITCQPQLQQFVCELPWKLTVYLMVQQFKDD